MSQVILAPQSIAEELSALALSLSDDGQLRVVPADVETADNRFVYPFIEKEVPPTKGTAGLGIMRLHGYKEIHTVPGLNILGMQTQSFSGLCREGSTVAIEHDGKYYVGDQFGTPVAVVFVEDGRVRADECDGSIEYLRGHHEQLIALDELPSEVIIPLTSTYHRGLMEYARDRGYVLHRLLGDDLFGQAMQSSDPRVQLVMSRLVGAINGFSEVADQGAKELIRTIHTSSQGPNAPIDSVGIYTRDRAHAIGGNTEHFDRLVGILARGVEHFRADVIQALELARSIAPESPDRSL